MKFELTQEIIDQIIFGMENQESLNLFDTHTMRLVPETEAINIESVEKAKSTEVEDWLFEDRFIPLPDWKSVDGYNLMEGFVASLRNPLYRENLRRILQSGKGVFRQFKDALKERADIERLWFRHKQREMRQRVIEWYNEQRELWGLAPFSIEAEAETVELLLSDFEFVVAGSADSEMLSEWDRDLFVDMFPGAQPSEIDCYYAMRRLGLPQPASIETSFAIVAKTPSGEVAGFLWAIEGGNFGKAAESHISRIIQIGVDVDYRGLGMASTLIHLYHKKAIERKINRILIDVPASADFIAKNLRREGFIPHAMVFELELTADLD